MLSSRHASEAASESQSRTKSLAKSGGLSEPDTPKGRRKADTLPCDNTTSGCAGCCLSSLVTGCFHVRLVARVTDWTSSDRRQVLHTMTNHMLQSKSRVKIPESIAPLHSCFMQFSLNRRPAREVLVTRSFSSGRVPEVMIVKLIDLGSLIARLDIPVATEPNTTSKVIPVIAKAQRRSALVDQARYRTPQSTRKMNQCFLATIQVAIRSLWESTHDPVVPHIRTMTVHESTEPEASGQHFESSASQHHIGLPDVGSSSKTSGSSYVHEY